VNDFESAFQSGNHFLARVLIQVPNGIVAGYDKISVHKRDHSSFDLTGCSILVCPELEIVSQARIVVVVDEDIMLSSISVPPFALRLDVEIRVILSCVVGFSNARGAIDPDSSAGIVGVGGLLVDLEQVHGLLYLLVLANIDKSLFHGSGDSDLEDLLVESGDISLLVSASGSYSKCPGSVEASVILVAVFICSIIFFNKFKMGYTTLSLEKADALLIFGLHKVLDVGRAFFAFLQLAGDEDDSFFLRPCFQIFSGIDLGVVVGSNDHACLCHVCRRFNIILINDDTGVLI
jgi:hypothetical protein